MANANEARKVVFELFQDLDRLSLDDCRPLSDIDAGKSRIMTFLDQALPEEGGSLSRIDGKSFVMSMNGIGSPITCTLDRDLAREDDRFVLTGIDHPIMNTLINRW